MSSNSTYIIAEAGVNHNGSFDLALKLIDMAIEAKVDAIKFQTFKAENLVTKAASKAEYQKISTDAAESQYDMLKQLELSFEEQKELYQYCLKKKIEFISTPFDLESAHLLIKDLNIPKIKISSGDITNAPLLYEIAQSGKEVILSTGMSTLGEVEKALGVLAFGYLNNRKQPSREAFQAAYSSKEGQQSLASKVTLLHCTTEYPTPFTEVNLLAMDTLAQAFALPVGYSDHTPGIAVSIGAVARGARIIEKHFTLDKNLPGPDHKASLDPAELKLLVNSIREIEEALGSMVKYPTPTEVKNMAVARKSLVAAKDILVGEEYTEDNLTVKRPGNGISPFKYWETLGQRAQKDLKEGELL